jgi:hypothetical protein
MNKEVCIQLHKLIDNCDEQGAINLIKTEKDINVSYEHNGNMPIFSAVNNKMYELFEVIANHPTFDSAIEDGFGETLLQSLMYLYRDDDIFKDESEKKTLERLINVLLNSKFNDLNATDINLDTAINLACESSRTLWIVEALAAKENVNINIINGIGAAAITTCIINKNLDALKILSKRKDLNVSVDDLDLAEKNGIDLSEYGIEIAKKLKKAHDYAFKTV